MRLKIINKKTKQNKYENKNMIKYDDKTYETQHNYKTKINLNTKHNLIKSTKHNLTKIRYTIEHMMFNKYEQYEA